jgi:hypothetical protein
MGRAQGRGKVHIEFRWGNLSERDHLEDPDLDAKIILKLIFKKRDGGGVHGLGVAVVNAVMKLHIP